MTYPSFSEHIRARYGSNWCVAPRASKHTARYDRVITPKTFALEQDAWARAHPAWKLADSLPDDEAGRFVRKAVLARLGGEA